MVTLYNLYNLQDRQYRNDINGLDTLFQVNYLISTQKPVYRSSQCVYMSDFNCVIHELKWIWDRGLSV